MPTKKDTYLSKEEADRFLAAIKNLFAEGENIINPKNNNGAVNLAKAIYYLLISKQREVFKIVELTDELYKLALQLKLLHLVEKPDKALSLTTWKKLSAQLNRVLNKIVNERYLKDYLKMENNYINGKSVGITCLLKTENKDLSEEWIDKNHVDHFNSILYRECQPDFLEKNKYYKTIGEREDKKRKRNTENDMLPYQALLAESVSPAIKLFFDKQTTFHLIPLQAIKRESASLENIISSSKLTRL